MGSEKRHIAVTFILLALFATAKAEENKWLDDYHQPVGFTWDASAIVNTNYIWRGLYVGGLNLQADASVGYGGAFFNIWCNIGATDWKFNGFLPELDTSIGFSRWGLTVLFIHMYNFDRYSNGRRSRFFDFSDPEDGIGGVNTEFRIRYKVSSKLPLSILWCTRFWGRDGYFVEDVVAGEDTRVPKRKRAYSTYIELGYDFSLPWELVMPVRFAMTPWKSLYTWYEGDFAVVNIQVGLRRDWKLTDYCRLRVAGTLMLNPYAIDKENVKWDTGNPGRQRLNANLGVGIVFD